jgi:hypothetical protein
MVDDLDRLIADQRARDPEFADALARAGARSGRVVHADVWRADSPRRSRRLAWAVGLRRRWRWLVIDADAREVRGGAWTRAGAVAALDRTVARLRGDR